MKLTRYGRREWGTATVIAILLLAITVSCGFLFASNAGFYLSILVIALWAAFAGFFRDPARVIPEGDDLVLSPADGLVKDIELIRASDCPQLAEIFEGHDMLRIGIFLSVFNVHLNRAPADLTVKLSVHKDGCYYDARDNRAIKENESQLIAGTATIAGKEYPLAVKQISGAIARRIVCGAEPRMRLKRGEQYGMIKFGSRTELYLPAKSDLEISVRIGDKVQGGLTVIARANRSNA